MSAPLPARPPVSFASWMGSAPFVIVEDLVSKGACPYCTLRFVTSRADKLYRLPERELVEAMCAGSPTDSEDARAFRARLHALFLQRGVCVLCLDVLPPTPSLVAFIHEVVQKGDYHFDAFSLFKTFPASLVIRQHGMWLYLHNTHKAAFPASSFGYSDSPEGRVIDLKEASKWIHLPHVAAAIARLGRGDRPQAVVDGLVGCGALAATVPTAAAATSSASAAAAAVASPSQTATPAKTFNSDAPFRLHTLYLCQTSPNELALRSELESNWDKSGKGSKGSTSNGFSVSSNLPKLLHKVKYSTLVKLDFAPPRLPEAPLREGAILSISAPPLASEFFTTRRQPSSQQLQQQPQGASSQSVPSSAAAGASLLHQAPPRPASPSPSAGSQGNSDSDDPSDRKRHCPGPRQQPAGPASASSASSSMAAAAAAAATSAPASAPAASPAPTTSPSASPASASVIYRPKADSKYAVFREAVFQTDEIRRALPRAWEAHAVRVRRRVAVPGAVAMTSTSTSSAESKTMTDGDTTATESELAAAVQALQAISSSSDLASLSPSSSSASTDDDDTFGANVLAVEGTVAAHEESSVLQVSPYVCLEAFCSHANVLVQGSYQKLSRVVSQTAWTVHTVGTPAWAAPAGGAGAGASAARAAAAAAAAAAGASAADADADGDDDVAAPSGGAGGGAASGAGGDGDDEEGGPVAESSVEAEISRELLPVFKPAGGRFKFHASGREDLNVRMLGGGRPFFLEFCDPHRLVDETQGQTLAAQYAALQDKIHASTSLVQVFGLTAGNAKSFEAMAKGIAEKRKKYRCVVYSQRRLDGPQSLEPINQLGDQMIDVIQATPVRVIFRRAAMDRKRTVNGLKATYIAPHWFFLDLETQAGTYVKEFVHSDRGRSRPSCSELLGTQCSIIQLDVTDLVL